MERIFSKSRYLIGLQCGRYLWFRYNDPEKIPPFDEVSQFIFRQGHEVGELAKKCFPGGVEVFHSDYSKEGIKKAIEETRLRTSEREILFEPSFEYKNTFCRPDILIPSIRGGWDLIEVKSSTSKKEVNIHDISFQKYCLEGAGIKIGKCYLMYINSDYIKKGKIDPNEFFTREDVTDEVMIVYGSVSENLSRMSSIVEMGSPPGIKIGKHCYNPYECPLKDGCWETLPENNVFELYWGKDKAARFMEQGIIKIDDIEDISNLNPKQKIQYNCAKSGNTFIDKDRIRTFLEALDFPIYLLDFETFATAIPLFEGTKPYQNIPFQYSCHIYQKIDREYSRHISFIYDGDSDPRQEFLASLKEALGYGTTKNPAGSILVYFKSFEISILRQLSEAFKDHSWWLEDSIERIKDLYEPFGDFCFYDSRQKGSASLKKVLPAITGSGYEGLGIDNGQTASTRYLQYAYKKTRQNEKESEKVCRDLEEYCGLDTSGMMEILLRLNDLLR